MKTLFLTLAMVLCLGSFTQANELVIDGSKVIMVAQNEAPAAAEVAPEAAPVAAEEAVEIDGGADMDVITKALMSLMEGKKSTLAMMIAALMLLLELMKSKIASGWFGSQSRLVRRAIVLIGGQALGMMTMVMDGQTLMQALVAGLITSGGAMSAYEMAIKPLMKKS